MCSPKPNNKNRTANPVSANPEEILLLKEITHNYTPLAGSLTLILSVRFSSKCNALTGDTVKQ